MPCDVRFRSKVSVRWVKPAMVVALAKSFAESRELMDVLAATVANHGEVKDWRRPAATLPGRNNKGGYASFPSRPDIWLIA